MQEVFRLSCNASLSLSLWRTLVVLCLGFLVAEPSAAQGWWREIPVPNDSVYTIVQKDDRFVQRYVIRQGQQPMFLLPSVSSFRNIVASVDGTPTLVYNEPVRSEGVLWYPALAARAQPYNVRIEVLDNGYQPYHDDFELVVVPPATRAFTDDAHYAAAVAINSNGPVFRTRDNTMLLWSSAPATSPASLDKPMLMVEGIDAEQKNHPAVYYGLGAAIFGQGQSEGADVVILDFADGGRDMVQNAAVVAEAVRTVRRFSTNRQRGVDVVGVSMGGVVARYALAQMEEPTYGQQSHAATRFVSLDAPQQGAVVDYHFQAAINELSSNAPLPLLFWRRASAQLLQRFYWPSGQGFHTAFYQDLLSRNSGHGYPRRTENVGVSFGALQGNPPRNPDEGDEWLEIRKPLFNPHFYVVEDIAQPGSWLPEDATDIWGRTYFKFIPVTYELDRKPGGNPTFIPFVSALDRTSIYGPSRFDGPNIYPATTAYHDRVPPNDVAPRVLHRMGYNAPTPTSVQISGPTSLAQGERGWWKATTNLGPEYGFPYYWEYRLVWPGCWGDDEPMMAQRGIAEDASESASKPGGGEVDLISCGQWAEGTVSAHFQMGVVASNIWMEIRVRADDSLPGGGTASVYSPVFTVSIGYTPPPDPEWNLSGEGAAVERPAFAVSDATPQPVRAGQVFAFDVTAPEAGPVEAVLYDVLGREVHRERREQGAGVEPWRMALPDVPAGTYMLRVETGPRSRTQVVRVQR